MARVDWPFKAPFRQAHNFVVEFAMSLGWKHDVIAPKTPWHHDHEPTHRPCERPDDDDDLLNRRSGVWQTSSRVP